MSRWGIFDSDNDFDNRFLHGYNSGLSYRFLKNHFFVEPFVQYGQRGDHYGAEFASTTVISPDPTNGRETVYVQNFNKFSYFETGLVSGYQFTLSDRFSVDAYGGLYYGYMHKGKKKSVWDRDAYRTGGSLDVVYEPVIVQDLSEEEYARLHRHEMGLVLGSRFTVGLGVVSMFIDARYQQGLTRVYSIPEEAMFLHRKQPRNSALLLSVGVGIPFGM